MCFLWSRRKGWTFSKRNVAEAKKKTKKKHKNKKEEEKKPNSQKMRKNKQKKKEEKKEEEKKPTAQNEKAKSTKMKKPKAVRVIHRPCGLKLSLKCYGNQTQNGRQLSVLVVTVDKHPSNSPRTY